MNDVDRLIRQISITVFDKWRDLIAHYSKKIKYLRNQPNYSPDYVYLHLKEPIDVTCLSALFPNLRIAEFSYPLEVPIEDIVKLIRDSECLKGIIHYGVNFKDFDFESIPENASLEMLTTGYIDRNMSGIYENVKQLHLLFSSLGLFERVAHRFPNLERLRIHAAEDVSEQPSVAPVMANLKIFEINLPVDDWVSLCFSFMDKCPALQSAYIRFESRRIVFNHLIKNANLLDLAIQFVSMVFCRYLFIFLNYEITFICRLLFIFSVQMLFIHIASQIYIYSLTPYILIFLQYRHLGELQGEQLILQFKY
uniref:F-box domain-containing protein n=1 Tax=Tetranychus urticae TaxID=32264 RepID=T1L5M5_TETUR